MERQLKEGVEPYATIFEELDAVKTSVTQLTQKLTSLATKVGTLEENVSQLTHDVNAQASDTGWINLPLASGISAYSSAQMPRYRKIGKFVIVTGAVKGITKDKTIVGTLPVGFRPSKVVSFPQNTSQFSGMPYFARWQVQTDGELEMQYTDYVWEELDGSEWFPVDVIFVVD